MKKLIYLILMFFIVSCASIHSGRYGLAVREDGSIARSGKVPTEGGFVISGDLDGAFTSDFYKFMVFTFENRSGSIATIKDVTPIFQGDDFNSSVKITSGNELKNWYDAQIAEKERKEKSRTTVSGVAAMAGGLLAVFTDDTWGAIGEGLLVGGVVSLTVDELYKEKRSIERGKVFPDSHLMAGEFQVPAGLYKRKWILFNVDGGNLPTDVILEYEVEDKTERVMVPLKW